MNWQHKEEEFWPPRETKVNRVFDIYGKTIVVTLCRIMTLDVKTTSTFLEGRHYINSK